MTVETDYLASYLETFKLAYSLKPAIILNLDKELVYNTDSFEEILELSYKGKDLNKPNFEWQENQIVNLFGNVIGTLVRFNPTNEENFKGLTWNLDQQVPFCLNS